MSAQTNDTIDDARLVSSCRKGDRNAFEQLVNRHQKMMLNIALRITGNFDDACDITQEAFLNAWRKISEFRGESRFSTWVAAIVVNLSRNKIQQLHTRSGHEAYSLDDPSCEITGFCRPSPVSNMQSALDKIEEEQIREAIRNCVGRLPAEFREVLVLRDMHGFSYDEVVNALGIKEGTVKSRLFRARDGVKDCLRNALAD